MGRQRASSTWSRSSLSAKRFSAASRPCIAVYVRLPLDLLLDRSSSWGRHSCTAKSRQAIRHEQGMMPSLQSNAAHVGNRVAEKWIGTVRQSKRFRRTAKLTPYPVYMQHTCSGCGTAWRECGPRNLGFSFFMAIHSFLYLQDILRLAALRSTSFRLTEAASGGLHL